MSMLTVEIERHWFTRAMIRKVWWYGFAAGLTTGIVAASLAVLVWA